MTVLRFARQLREESLDAVAASVGATKAWLSVAERYPGRHISKRLQKRLAQHFGADWATLARQIDGAAFAASFLNSVSKQKGSP